MSQPVRSPYVPSAEHRVARQLRHRLNLSGGFTWHPETREQPNAGFAVCADRRLSKEIAWDAWDNHHVTRWLQSLSGDLRRGSNYLGGWLERGCGRAWLEVVVVVPADQLVLAMHLAARARQQAVFDLATGTVVAVPANATSPLRHRGVAAALESASCDVR